MSSQIVTTREATLQAGELGGMRAQFLSVGKAHAESDPEAMKEHLRPGLKKFCDMLLRGVDKGDRTAMRLYPELMGAVGGKQDILAAFVVAVGARSPEHMKSAASAALDAEAVDDETAYTQALTFVNDYRRQNGLPPLVEPANESNGEVPGA